MMVPLFASACLFLAVCLAAYALLTRSKVSTPSDNRLRALRVDAGGSREEGSATLRRGRTSIPGLRGVLNNSGWAEKTELTLRQANVQLRVGEYLILRLALAAVLFGGATLISQMNPIGIAIGIGLAAAGYLLPGMAVSIARGRRIERLEAQLTELAPMLASSLRSGFALQQGLELASHQLEPPISDELVQLTTDLNLGATLDAAMLDFARRIGSPDFDMLVTAILIQRTSGGNLSEVLDQTAETLRERERIRGEIKTLTASQRMTGMVLSVYPAAVGLILFAILPSIWKLLFTEQLGLILLSIAVGLQVIGFLVIRRIVNIRI